MPAHIVFIFGSLADFYKYLRRDAVVKLYFRVIFAVLFDLARDRDLSLVYDDVVALLDLVSDLLGCDRAEKLSFLARLCVDNYCL